MEPASDAVVALVTAPDVATAETIARALVEESLAACCNLLPTVRSIYRWEGALEQADETLVVIKTTSERFDTLRDRIVELHPYDVPEIIALPVVAGHAPYLEWVRGSVEGGGVSRAEGGGRRAESER